MKEKKIDSTSEVPGIGYNFVLHSEEQRAELKHAAKVEDPCRVLEIMGGCPWHAVLHTEFCDYISLKNLIKNIWSYQTVTCSKV